MNLKIFYLLQKLRIERLSLILFNHGFKIRFTLMYLKIMYIKCIDTIRRTTYKISWKNIKALLTTQASCNDRIGCPSMKNIY